jgi:hypothetical protein
VIEHFLLLGAMITGSDDGRDFTEVELHRRGGVVVTFDFDGPTDAKPTEIEAAIRRRLWGKTIGVKIDGTKSVQVLLTPEDARVADIQVEHILRAPVDLALRIVADRRTHPQEIKLAERQWPNWKAATHLVVNDGANPAAEFVPFGRWIPEANRELIEEAKELAFTTDRLSFRDHHPSEYRFVEKDLILTDGAPPQGDWLIRKADGKEWVLARDESIIGFDEQNHLVRDAGRNQRYVLLIRGANARPSHLTLDQYCKENENGKGLALSPSWSTSSRRIRRCPSGWLQSLHRLKILPIRAWSGLAPTTSSSSSSSRCAAPSPAPIPGPTSSASARVG